MRRQKISSILLDDAVNQQTYKISRVLGFFAPALCSPSLQGLRHRASSKGRLDTRSRPCLPWGVSTALVRSNKMTITYNINSKDRESIRMSTEQHAKKPFSRTDVVEFEVAQDGINSFACYWSRQISKEEKKDSPNRAKIEAL